MALTAFTKQLGATQGRIKAPSAPDGEYVFVLGSEVEGAMERLEIGDYIELKQTVNMTGIRLVRANLVMRVPESLPAGYRWKASLRVDGAERVSTYGSRGKTRRISDLAVVNYGTTGNAELALRLELTTA